MDGLNHIREDDLTHPSVLELLQIHLAGMQENSPADSVYALDLSGLKTRDITVWTMWADNKAIGIVALKFLGDGAGEIKSMRTHPKYLRKGVGRGLLELIIKVSNDRGYNKLSLETGSGASFDAALKLYRKYGFKNGEPFGTYIASEFNQFLHLDLK